MGLEAIEAQAMALAAATVLVHQPGQLVEEEQTVGSGLAGGCLGSFGAACRRPCLHWFGGSLLEVASISALTGCAG